MPAVSTVVGSAARVAAAGSASARPPDMSSGGKMPWASARSSCDRVLQVALDLVDHRHGVVGVVLDRIPGEAQLDGEGDEVLLGAVVEVALELAPLGVAGRDDAGPRLLQLVVAQLQLVEAGLQGGVELHVVQRQGDLAGELGEHVVLGLGERLAVAAAGDDDEAEQLAGVGDGREPHRRRAVGDRRAAAARCRARSRR